jgi:hypothetical protein
MMQAIHSKSLPVLSYTDDALSGWWRLELGHLSVDVIQPQRSFNSAHAPWRYHPRALRQSAIGGEPSSTTPMDDQPRVLLGC